MNPTPERNRAGLVLLAGIVVVGLALRWLGVGSPWGGPDFHSVFGGFGSGAFARNFVEHGFLESGLMPFRWRVETIDGLVERFWYTHHPAGYSLLSGVALQLLGVHEWALQVPPLLFSLLSIVACYRLTRDLLDARTALLAAAFFAVLPMGVFYGILTWAEVPIAWLHMLLVRSYLLWLRRSERRHLWLCALYVLLGGMLDWPANFVLPGLGLHLILTARRQHMWERTKAFVPLGIAAAIPLALHWFHLRAVRPATLAEVDTDHTLAWVTTLSVPLPQFLSFQLEHLVRYFTLPALLLCVFGLLREVTGRVSARDSFARGLLPTLLLPGLLYVGLFPARSINHDFFWYLALPWVSITAARESMFLLRRLTRRANPSSEAGPGRATIGLPALIGSGVIGLVLAACARGGANLWRQQRASIAPLPVESPWLAALVTDSETVVVATSGRTMLLSFYSVAPILGGIDTAEKLQDLRSNLLTRIPAGHRIVFLYDMIWHPLFADLRVFLDECSAGSVRGPAGSPFAFVEYDITEWVRSDNVEAGSGDE